MSNTVITNYTDLNGPSTKADSSVVVIVNKDGSLSVDEKLLGAFMNSDGSQGTGISVVRVGHDGRPDDATDSETEDDSVPHVTLSVDSYYDEPNSIVKYDSGAEMLQSLRLETRENSLLGFQNDHCYTSFTSSNEILQPSADKFPGYDEPILEIKPQQPSKTPIPSSKKISVLEQQILPKSKKILIDPSDSPALFKGDDLLNKPLPGAKKTKYVSDQGSAYDSNDDSKDLSKSNDENVDTSSISTSGDSVPDRDSDSDYEDAQEKVILTKTKQKFKSRPRILKSQSSKVPKDTKSVGRGRTAKTLIKRETKGKLLNKNATALAEKKHAEIKSKEVELNVPGSISNPSPEQKQIQKASRKEKKTPAHMTALLSDMTSLFSSPDVIRRVSTDNKVPLKPEKATPGNKRIDENEEKPRDKPLILQKANLRAKSTPKVYEPIPQLDEASLAQLLQDPTGITANSSKSTIAPSLNSPGLAGPLSPTLDLLGGLQPEEEGLTEDLLMHVAQLVESSENLQEVIDKQVLGKVDSHSMKANIQSQFQQAQSDNIYNQNTPKGTKSVVPRKDPIEIVRRDGRVITLPPIEAPATRASKRKSQLAEPQVEQPVSIPMPGTPEPQFIQQVSKQYSNKKLANKKEYPMAVASTSKILPDSEESWNSEDDPDRLWCICKQPHNNRFMICCDRCEDWFHGKCVNITKIMGQQMEQQGIEWTCPNCVKKIQTPKSYPKPLLNRRAESGEFMSTPRRRSADVKNVGSKTSCIVCKKEARANSIYCSDACILKYAHDSVSPQASSTKWDESGTPSRKQNDSRVIVFERTTGRCLDGPNAPTAENLKAWLQKNPTFEVVRPGALSTIKPSPNIRKAVPQQKVQTILNFERIPKKSIGSGQNVTKPQTPTEPKEVKSFPFKDDNVKSYSKMPRIPVTPKQTAEPPKSLTPRTHADLKKPSRMMLKQSTEKLSPVPVAPATPRRKEKEVDSRRKSSSSEPIRDNVRKSLQEQMMLRMSENKEDKFTEEEVRVFASETEAELHELFREVGMKYKAKYRSLMFNIKDRKNLSLWQKICDRDITPKQLVRLSPEELASQELAQWRDKEAKHQLELIKKSELDLLAASKTYVLKTHKGEEVMQSKTSVSTELDPQVPVEDLVTALNDSTATEDTTQTDSPKNISQDSERKSSSDVDKRSSRKRENVDSSSTRTKKSSKRSKRDSEERRSSRKRSRSKQRGERSSHRLEKRATRARSGSKEKSRLSDSQSSGSSKRKSESQERSRRRSPTRGKSKRISKSRERSRTRSRSRARSLRRDRLSSRSRSKNRSQSRETRSKLRSRSKNKVLATEKVKPRSQSQDNEHSEKKYDEPVERPKSAMLKEVHPEYDPHEPMITSAVSEEDLRKSRDDVYEKNYGDEVVTETTKETNRNPTKLFTITTTSTSTRTTRSRAKGKGEKVSAEVESDQEPSSTVDMSSVTVWNGCINMVDVARFYVAAHEVSGNGADLEEDLTAELDIVGRINPDTVWDYISKMKRTGNKDIVILRLSAANDEEKMQYIALYSYLSSRNRLGVVRVPSTTTVKDFYIVPLSANSSIPQVLLPLEGPGLDDVRTHLLLAIVIRQRKKRSAPGIPKDTIPAKVAQESRNRSFTPPVAKAFTPPASPRRRAPLPVPYTSPMLSTSVKDKIAASLASADDEEAYSPGSSSSGASGTGTGAVSAATAAAVVGAGAAGVGTSAANADALRTKMEELNRQIEEQKQQIRKIAQGESSSVGEDEAYSPSRPMTPPPVVPLADIALPSNLQEILATIKQRSEATTTMPSMTDIDMRIPAPSPDPHSNL